MKTNEFAKQAKIGDRVLIAKESYTILERVKWKMLRTGNFYHKYVLKNKSGNDSCVLAEDPHSGRFILVRLFEFAAKDPFLPELELRGKKFKFSCGEVCIAVEQQGKKYHKLGAYDIWWDYEAADGSYLSLGIAIPSNHREDLIGRWVEPAEVKLVK